LIQRNQEGVPPIIDGLKENEHVFKLNPQINGAHQKQGGAFVVSFCRPLFWRSSMAKKWVRFANRPIPQNKNPENSQHLSLDTSASVSCRRTSGVPKWVPFPKRHLCPPAKT